MLLECLIEREGVTEVNLDKAKYMFRPIRPYNAKGHKVPSTSICDVTSEPHIKRFIDSGQYRPYVESNLPPVAEEVPNPKSGYRFDKHQDGTVNAGYIVTDTNRDRWGGVTGWVEDKKLVVPFNSEIDADQWLSEELQFEEPVSFDCEFCGKSFTEEINLKRHRSTAHKDPK